jgi:hypothetical protein
VTIVHQPDSKNYRINAVGRVSRGGHSNPVLASADSGAVQSDGTLAFDFVATPPAKGTITTQAFVTLKATTTIGGPGLSLEGLKRVRVNASKNSMDASFPPE